MDPLKYINSAPYTSIEEVKPPAIQSSKNSSMAGTFRLQNQQESRRTANETLKYNIAKQYGEESTDEESPFPSHEGTPLLSRQRKKTYGGEAEKAHAERHKDQAWSNFIAKQENSQSKRVSDIKTWGTQQQGLSLSEASAWFFSQK